jgi:hypothetical protein
VELEEKDPEVILEERRRKRAEIMAKFQAQGRTEKQVDSAAASPAPEVGTGQDSYNSGGIRTGESHLPSLLCLVLISRCYFTTEAAWYSFNLEIPPFL